MEHWRAYLRPSEIPVIEVTLRCLHMCDRPMRYPTRPVKRLRIRGREKRERVDRLSGALNVDRQQAVVHVLRATVGLKEITFEVFIASQHMSGKLRVFRAVDVLLQAVKIVAGMKAIDPMVL